MEPHPFHKAVGRLIKKHFAPDYTVLVDRACDPEGKRISLFNRTSDTTFRYCDVDILIAAKEEARVIIEIEESNFKPNQVFGKFFASAFSDQFMVGGRSKDRYRPIVKLVLFVQVLDLSKVKEAKSVKPGQWENAKEQIQSFLKIGMGQITEYVLFRGEQKEFESGDGESKKMIEVIKGFISKIPEGNLVHFSV